VELVWNLSDLFNGLMVIPNLIALLALSGLVVKISRENWEEEDEKSAEEQFVPVQSAGME
jgi:alanine or glycine:cation symporter, AGCS family